jgi:hypothetical protein
MGETLSLPIALCFLNLQAQTENRLAAVSLKSFRCFDQAATRGVAFFRFLRRAGLGFAVQGINGRSLSPFLSRYMKALRDRHWRA